MLMGLFMILGFVEFLDYLNGTRLGSFYRVVLLKPTFFLRDIPMYTTSFVLHAGRFPPVAGSGVLPRAFAQFHTLYLKP